MSKPNHSRQYLGSFRIRLASNASVEGVPKSPLVNVLDGGEIYILDGKACRAGRVWKFSVKGVAFGWEDSRIEEIIHNNQTIFTENSAKAIIQRGE